VDGRGIPLRVVTDPVNRHDSPLLDHALRTLGELPDQASVYLDRAYDSLTARRKLKARYLIGEILRKGKPAPLSATKRWVVERTNSWHNSHKKLVWCTERRGPVIDFWVAFSEVVIIVRRLIRECWSR
jgi:IS5 family transposase